MSRSAAALTAVARDLGWDRSPGETAAFALGYNAGLGDAEKLISELQVSGLVFGHCHFNRSGGTSTHPLDPTRAPHQFWRTNKPQALASDVRGYASNHNWLACSVLDFFGSSQRLLRRHLPHPTRTRTCVQYIDHAPYSPYCTLA
jgi:hypothetical protein